MPAAPSAPDATTDALLDALVALRQAVDAAHPRLPDLEPGGERDGRRRRLVWHLDEFLLPRVRDLTAPLVAVLIGSTGAGKSSLANGLAGQVVSPSGVVRPTTRRPVVLLAPGDVDAFLGRRLLAPMAEQDRLEVVVAEDAVAGLALVDAPDVDSVEAANREAADELLAAADLCVFVTTAQRYADAVPWSFLHRARDRGVPLVVVVNRLPPAAADRDAVMADCRRRFHEAGLDRAGPASEAAGGAALTFVPVTEGERDPAIDGLLPEAVEPLRRILDAAAASGPAASPVRRQALRGALAGLRNAVGQVAGDLEADERRAAALRAVVRRAYGAELARLKERLASGVFLRGEVLRAWQDFVGAGDVARALSSGIGRVRAWFARRTGGNGTAVQLEDAKELAFAELAAALVAHAEAAAHQVADDWAGDPVSARLLAGHPGLWSHGEGLHGIAGQELHAWLGRLVEQVRERGQGRKAVAFAATVGVNAVGVAAMLAVFAHTAGLTLGEAAIAGGTAVVNQKLLEALFGDAAVASLVREAEADLTATLARVLDQDAERFTALVAPPEVGPSELTEAAGAVERAAAGTLEAG